jgi:wobble nucleotide-excising tRNase
MHQATLSLTTIRHDLGELSKLAQDIKNNKEIYAQMLGTSNTDIDYDNLNLSHEDIKTICSSIDKKINEMSSSIILDKMILSKSINSIVDCITTLNDAKKRASQNLMEKINRLETLVKGAIGFEIKSSQTIIDNLDQIKNLDEQLEQLAVRQKNLEEKNEDLLNQKSDLADFATYLNQVLTDLGLNFRLLPSGKVFALKHDDGGVLKLDDISDGERNLLSLIYFYYEMLDDSSGVFKDTVKIIIIDDPISSLDDNNKFYITELMKSVLDQASIQVFILTHSWDDFYNLSYGRAHEKTSLYEVKKEMGVSRIASISNGKLLKPYIMLYREVDAFRLQSQGTITDEIALHMPNTMRRILEEYIKFRVNVDFATASQNGDICKALFGEEIATLSNTKKQKLNLLLDVCNILSHKANQPKNPSEIHDSAKFLISSIELNDKYHHIKMRGD